MNLSTYPGRKSQINLQPHILGIFPPHQFYWELCAGTAQILWKKAPAEQSFVVDKNVSLVQGDNNVYPAGTVVIEGCAISWLQQIKNLGPNHLVYIDPPYIISERKQKKALYQHEFTDTDHQQLLLAALDTSCRVVISHYHCRQYNDALKGWNKKVVKVSYRGSVAEECIYYNFSLAAGAAEPIYSGSNKTDRQRMKRKAARWVKNFSKLPVYEQQQILNAINASNVHRSEPLY